MRKLVLLLLILTSFTSNAVLGANLYMNNYMNEFIKYDKGDNLSLYATSTIQADDLIPSIGHSNKSEINQKAVNYITWGAPLLFVTYGALFWDWGGASDFKTRDEGWFGSSTYAGGADKLSHMYSHYVVKRVTYNLYRHYGLPKKQALKRSFILASSIGLLVEIGDGISHYGFSSEDLLSDMIGICLGHILNSNEYLNKLIGFQLWWKPSDSDNSYKSLSPIDDYNNQKYFFNLRFAAIPYLKNSKLTRYVNFDLGFYTRGYKNSADNVVKISTISAGLSINFSQLLDDNFSESRPANYASAVLKYYQPPMTGISVIKWEDRD